MSDEILETIRVKRKGGSGSHLINRSKYETDPKAYTLVDEPDPNDESGLSEKTVKELVALAVERGVDLGEATKKADIVALLEAAAAADQE